MRIYCAFSIKQYAKIGDKALDKINIYSNLYFAIWKNGEKESQCRCRPL